MTITESAQPKGLLKEADIQRLTGMSIGSIRRWRWLGIGPAFIKICGSSVRYDPDVVSKWIASQPTGGGGTVEGGK